MTRRLRASPAGGAGLTLFMLALTRLLLPGALIPATTALNTVAGDGMERGILAGANVVMPNLTPPRQRSRYLLYDNKTTAPWSRLTPSRRALKRLGTASPSPEATAARTEIQFCTEGEGPGLTR